MDLELEKKALTDREEEKPPLREKEEQSKECLTARRCPEDYSFEDGM